MTGRIRYLAWGRNVLLGVGLLTLVSTRAWGQPADVDRCLRAATALFEKLQYERALSELTHAQTLTRSVEQDVSLHLLAGIILGEMGRGEDSTAEFIAALYIRPDAQLPLTVSPKLSESFERTRTEVKSGIAKRPLPPPMSTGPSPASLTGAPTGWGAPGPPSLALFGLTAAAVWYGAWGIAARSTSLHNQSLATADAKGTYDKEIATFGAQAIAGLGVAAVAAGAGIWIWARRSPSSQDAVRARLMLVPSAAGATVAVGGFF